MLKYPRTTSYATLRDHYSCEARLELTGIQCRSSRGPPTDMDRYLRCWVPAGALAAPLRFTPILWLFWASLSAAPDHTTSERTRDFSPLQSNIRPEPSWSLRGFLSLDQQISVRSNSSDDVRPSSVFSAQTYYYDAEELVQHLTSTDFLSCCSGLGSISSWSPANTSRWTRIIRALIISILSTS